MSARWWRDYEQECAEWMRGLVDRSPPDTVMCILEDSGIYVRLRLWTNHPIAYGVFRIPSGKADHDPGDEDRS